MAAQFCTHELEGLASLVHLHETFMLTVCVSSLVSSLVATLGNLLVIHALWKASSIPANLKKLLLNLAIADLVVGSFAQLMFGVIIAMMLNMAANGRYRFDFLCPTILTVCYFFLFLLASASFLNITVIAVDRLYVIYLHLRYQELVTPQRVIITLVSLWLTSAVSASIFVSLRDRNRIVVVIMGLVGIPFTTVAYILIYKVVRHHQNQIT